MRGLTGRGHRCWRPELCRRLAGEIRDFRQDRVVGTITRFGWTVDTGDLLQVTLDVLSHLPEGIDCFAQALCRIELLDVVHCVADVIEFGLPQRLVELGTKLARRLAQTRRHLAKGTQHGWQVLRAHDHNQDNRNNKQFGPANIQHSQAPDAQGGQASWPPPITRHQPLAIRSGPETRPIVCFEETAQVALTWFRRPCDQPSCWAGWYHCRRPTCPS